MAQGKAKGPRNDPMQAFDEAMKDALEQVKRDPNLHGKTCKVQLRAQITDNPGEVGWYIVEITP